MGSTLIRCLLLAAWLVVFAVSTVAQAQLAPPEQTGKVAYIPFPVHINLDGKTDDWAKIPLIIVNRGPALSKDPAENGSFRFALAAEAGNLYILMLSTDKTIITGKHGPDSWNEDSLEFYLNLGENFGLKKYDANIVQCRIMPLDIGNADPAKLTLGGQNTEAWPIKAKLFKTSDGWGFEAVVKLSDATTPAHGKEIGVQFHANGAAELDRNVKLIWSLADKADNSWQDPSLFGRGIFFQAGRTDIPQVSVAAVPAAAESTTAISGPAAVSGIAINQTGYFPSGNKIGILAKPSAEALAWSLIDASTKVEVASGKTSPGAFDELSGDTVHRADFSAFTKPGSYMLVIDGVKSSVFRIGGDVLTSLATDALAYFYRTRSGIELKPEYAGKTWARPAGHLSDVEISAFQGKDAQGQAWKTFDYTIDGHGGWYDAGDFGKYVVNGGISVWTLQNAFERNPASFRDGGSAIPENHDGAPDILDEARWELDFLLRMQIPAGQPLAGMVFHKLHDRTWSGVPTALPLEMDNNNEHDNGGKFGRFVYEPSTAATLNLAATAAQAARLWKKLDAAFAARCLTAAKTAWKSARANPALIAGNVPGEGGGNYDDKTVDDDFFWAAAELYATTGEPEFRDFLRASPYFKAFPGLAAANANSFNWGDTAALGTITLVTAPNALEKTEIAGLQAQILATADRYLKTASSDGYGVPMEKSGYVWGSTSGVLNNGIILGLAFDISKKPSYRDGAVGAMDYILGLNSLHKSFVSGYGANPLAHPHHRVWGNNPDRGYPPPPPGVVSGGPNMNIQDPEMTKANLQSRPIAKRYLDMIGSYASNEVAINWNAPLAWLAAWLDQQYRNP